MKITIDNIEYPVVMMKKNNKNAYIRVREKTIYVTVPRYYSSKLVQEMLEENKKSIVKMLEKQTMKEEKEDEFWYLGKRYYVIKTPLYDIEFVGDKLFVKDEKSLNKYLDKKRKELFQERLDFWHSNFEEKIPYPTLKIRKMKTRWGVCNRKNNTVTLNSELLRYSIEKLDYVIIHELSHFKHFNHSTSFWNLVEKYEPNYKKIRKELR